MWNDRALPQRSSASDRIVCLRPPDNFLNSWGQSPEGSAPQPSNSHIGDASRTTASESFSRTLDFLVPDALTTTRVLHHAPFRRILLLYDNSLNAEKTLELGLDVARRCKAKLLIVGVGPLPDRSHLSELHTVIEDTRIRLSRKFYEVRVNAMNEGLPVETLLALGDAAELALRNAKRFRASLIIVGTLEVSGPSPSGARSVAQEVSSRAHCPVLVASELREETRMDFASGER